MRVFFALWPDADSQRHWQQALTAPLQFFPGRRLPPENLHLTLAFLGETAADRIPALIRLGDDLPTAAIDLRFDHLECWPQAGVAVMRASQIPAALRRLHGQMHSGLQQLGWPQEKQKFKPHITLAREVRVRAPQLPLWPVLEWQAPTLALLRSRLQPQGAQYALLHSWPLALNTTP